MSPTPSTAFRTLTARPGIGRAWPGPDSSLSYEYRDQQGRIRAGHIKADGTYEDLPYGQDPALPLLQGSLAQPESRLLVHRAGKRAVVMSPQGITKHLKKRKVAPVATATEAVGRLASRAGFTVARVLDTSKNSIDFSLIPGQTLYDLAGTDPAAWQEFARLWPRLHQEAQQPGLSLPLHGPAQEVAVLNQWLDHSALHGSLPTAAHTSLSYLAQATSAQLLDPQQDTPHSFLHRDLHDKQLLWDGTHLGILDVDTAAWGEPALDLANLLAHIDLRHIQGIISPSSADATRAVLLDLADTLAIPPQRLAAYQQAASIRIACVYSFRPSSYSWLPHWIDHTLTHNEG